MGNTSVLETAAVSPPSQNRPRLKTPFSLGFSLGKFSRDFFQWSLRANRSAARNPVDTVHCSTARKTRKGEPPFVQDTADLIRVLVQNIEKAVRVRSASTL
jgi:hypothetical protein